MHPINRILWTIWRERRAAAAVQMAIGLGLLIGVGGLAIDMARYVTLNSEIQKFADAAALAGAAELDGRANARTRATAAAQGAFAQNVSTFASQGPGLSIGTIRFLSALDGDTTATGDDNARFIEVISSMRSVNTYFITAVGGAAVASTAARAVAGYTQTICQIPPLMMCNPLESVSGGGGFDANLYKGRLLRLKAKGGGSQWGPGDFGVLESPLGSGTAVIREELAKLAPAACFGTKVDVRPGQMQSMRVGVNTRFDIYEPPFQGAADKALYKPAASVTKGALRQGNNFDYDSANALARTQKLPVDTCLPACATPLPARLGDGNWDRNLYWSKNHPANYAASGNQLPAMLRGLSGGPGIVGPSRYQTYRYEIENPSPAQTPSATYDADGKFITKENQGGNAAQDENGRPVNPAANDGCPNMWNAQCTDGNGVANDMINPDRRVMILTVLNCIEQGVQGSIDNVPVIEFVRVFLTEPYPPSSAPEPDMVNIELIEALVPGPGSKGVLRDIVQLYR